jgi:hypothetical protein
MSDQVQFRGFTLDQPTIDALLLAERLLGYQLSIMQGSWSNASASAGTHSGGGAVDISIENPDGSLVSWTDQVARVHALRAAGFRAWRRTPSQGFVYHVHGILAGDHLVSPSAAEQLVQWDAGLDGLADHGPDSDPVDTAAGRPPVYPRGAPVSLVLDIAWARPTTAQIKATGAVGVMRYFSPDGTKNLTAAEVTDYTANGMAVGTVYESTAGRATAGYAAGAADAHLAEQQRAAVGLPDTHIHHFAVDSDVPWSSVQAYFDGAASVVGLDRVGTYGSFRVVESAYGHGIRKLWQTLAWSGGQVSSHATLYQDGGTALSGSADTNRTLAADWGQYPRPGGAVDVPLTPAEIDAVGTNAANKVIAAMQDPATRDRLAFAPSYWEQIGNDPSSPLPTGANLPGVVAVAGRAQKVAAARDAKINALITELTSLGSGLTVLGTDLEAKLEAALATLPTAIQAALAAALVHVDITVTGPVPPAPPV